MSSPTPVPPEVNPTPDNALKAAAFRFVSALIGLGVGVAIIIYVPDPAVKIVGTAIVGAAALSIEEFFKTKAGV